MPNASDASELSLDYAQELLNAVPTGVIVTDANGTISYANAEGARLFGYLSRELIGESIDTLLPDRFRYHHAELRQSYCDNPETRYMGIGRDLYGKRKNGSEFPLEIGLRTLTTASKQLVVASIVDITKRKQLEDRFVSVIEASPYGKLLIDAKGIIQMINPSMLKLFGYTKEELLGKSMDVLLPERYRDIHSKHRDDYAKNPTLRAMGLGRDLTGRHKDGSEIPIEIGLNPVQTDEGQLILAAITDITERKRLDLRLQQANAHLEEFTYVASHDLKSPLRGISDLVEWIKEDFNEHTTTSTINNIERIKVRIGRMEQLINDLLSYARAGKRSGESSYVYVQTLINGIIDMHPIPSHYKVTCDIQIEHIQAAKTPLETVLRNLFSNALKHHDGIDPAITISAKAQGNFCLFSVSDNGPGIPEAARERVFRLFQTLTSSERASSGIGLALAKRLTESHGGKIELITKDGERGATFNVWWPRFPRRDIDEQ